MVIRPDAGRNLENRVRQRARARRGRAGGMGGVGGPIEAPQGLQGKPRRLTTRAGKPCNAKALRHAFQHDASNTPSTRPPNPRKSAIPELRAQLDPIGRQAPAKAESFAAAPPSNGADRTRSSAAGRPGRISGRQFIRSGPHRADRARPRQAGSTLEPLWNRCGTTNLLIYREIVSWFHGSSKMPSRMCVRAGAHMTRGPGVEPLEPAEKRCDINGLLVPARFHGGSTLEPSPRPGGTTMLASHYLGSPTGRGQAEAGRGRDKRTRAGLGQSGQGGAAGAAAAE